MDFRKKLGKLARVLALLVVAVRILADACEAGGIVSAADGYGGNTEKTVGLKIGRKTQGAEGIRVQVLVVGIDQLRAAREAERAGQYQRGTEGVRIIDREQVSRALVRPAPARIREIFEAVVGSSVVPVLRVLGAEQVLFAEAVVDLDVELVVAAGARSRGDPVVVNASSRDIRHGEQVHHLLGNRIDEVSGRLGQLVRRAVQFGISGAGIGGEVIERDIGAAVGAGGLIRRGLERAGIRIIELPSNHAAQRPSASNVPPLAAHNSPKSPLRSAALGTPA